MVNFDQLEVNRVAQGNFPPDLINPVFVLGSFCSISHGSTLRRKGWTNPTIHSQVFAFVLARGGCGRGASALPLKASAARRFAS